jgi:hypothetical protein
MYNQQYIQHYDAMQNYIYTATNKCQYDPYLMHYGVLGMKWGQHLFGKLTGSGNKSKSVADTATGKRLTSRSKSFANRVQRRMQIQQANKIKSAQKTLGLRDESGTTSKAKQKERVLKSRSAKELYKHADLFTTEELNTAYNRLSLEKRIKDLEPDEKKTSTVDKWINATQKAASLTNNASNIANNGIKLYNTMADIYNSTSSGSKMKKINTDKNSDKDGKD